MNQQQQHQGHDGEKRQLKVGGLDGVVVAETLLSEVNGEKGQLIIGGYALEQLAGRRSFESLCHLLWHGRLPSSSEERGMQQRLGKWRQWAFQQLSDVNPPLADGMDFLRATIASLSLPQDGDEREMVTAAVAVAAAIWQRRQQQVSPLPPDPQLGHAADYWRMMMGKAASAPMAAALDTYLVTVADHGMNASTFAARVVASTGSDLVSSVVAGIGALKGPLHGGAPGPVLDMLDAIGQAEHAQDWLEGELAANRRIMGMGHRIYRVRDPRAAVLERAIESLESQGHQSQRLSLARCVERAAATLLRERYPKRPLQANVEFYTAVLLDAIGLPRQQFSPTFAVGRVAGWCGHVGEQRQYGRLIRPDALYVGTRET